MATTGDALVENSSMESGTALELLLTSTAGTTPAGAGQTIIVDRIFAAVTTEAEAITADLISADLDDELGATIAGDISADLEDDVKGDLGP